MTAILQVFYAFLSSLLQTTAIPNELFLTGSPIVAMLCLSPLYVSAHKSKSYTFTFLIFALQTGFVHLFSSFWLGFYRDFALFTLGASALGTAFIGGFFLSTAFFLTRPKSTSFLENSQALRIISFSLVWTFWEYFKSNFGFLSYPWGTLSMSAYRWLHITQIADITGSYGITFLFSLTSSLLGEFFLNPHKPLFRPALSIALLYALTLCYGEYRLKEARHIEKQLCAVVVQQNIDPWLDKDDRIGIRRSQKLTDSVLSEMSEKADLIIWSEGVLNHSFPNAIPFYSNNPEEEPLLPYIASKHTPFLIGGAFTVTPKDVRPRRNSNVALLFDENAEIAGYHAKIHLVPFGEFIPLPNSQKVKTFLKKVFKISAGWIPGKEPHLFDINIKQTDENGRKKSVRFSTPICFEDAFSDIARKMFFQGSELFINITNDSWSMMKSAEYQHLAIATYRAIEFRTPMIRATNSGCTALILPTGHIVKELPLFAEYAAHIDLPIYSRTLTPFALCGDLFALFLISVIIILALISRVHLFAVDNLSSVQNELP